MDKINNNYMLYNPDSMKNKKDSKKVKKGGLFRTKEVRKKDSFDNILDNELEYDIDDINNTKVEERVTELLNQIGVQGRMLKKRQNMEELNRYKQLIREYINIIVNVSEETEKRVTWDRFKKQKVAKIHLKIVNEELLELTKIFLKEQRNVFEIASKIDKIEGLLIDLKS